MSGQARRTCIPRPALPVLGCHFLRLCKWESVLWATGTPTTFLGVTTSYNCHFSFLGVSDWFQGIRIHAICPSAMTRGNEVCHRHVFLADDLIMKWTQRFICGDVRYQWFPLWSKTKWNQRSYRQCHSQYFSIGAFRFRFKIEFEISRHKLRPRNLSWYWFAEILLTV